MSNKLNQINSQIKQGYVGIVCFFIIFFVFYTIVIDKLNLPSIDVLSGIFLYNGMIYMLFTTKNIIDMVYDIERLKHEYIIAEFNSL